MGAPDGIIEAFTGVRVLDTEYADDAATVVAAWPGGGVVLEYDDEPGVPVSINITPHSDYPRRPLLLTGERVPVTWRRDGSYRLGLAR